MFSFLGKNLIGYRYAASGNQFFYGVNPKTNADLTTPFYTATTEEVKSACELAKCAFPIYSQFTAAKRHEFILRICALLEENRSQLISFFCEETGLPEDRAQAELARSILQFKQYSLAVVEQRVFSYRLEEEDATRKPTPKPRIEKSAVPLGPVVVFGASNFPFAYATLGGDVASALAAGCPVIVKAHKMHPHTSSFSAELIRKAAIDTDMPEGIFSHLMDSGLEVGKQLVLDSRVKAVGFTGSIAGGKALLRLVQERSIPIPVFAEMGSVNPIFILEDALQDITTLATKIGDSVALNAGQFCTSPGFVFVPNSEEGSAFVQNLTEYLKGKPAQCMLHPEIKNRFIQRVEEHRKYCEELLPVTVDGNFVTPGLSEIKINVLLTEPLAQEELFGSYMNIVVYSSPEELLECIHNFVGQLTMSVFSKAPIDNSLLAELSNKAGRIIWNGVPTGVEVAAAQQHGGPFPSSSLAFFTAVGSDAVLRFMRPVAYQGWK